MGTAEQTEKLPKWARSHIATLEMRLKEAEKAATLWAEQTATRVCVPHWKGLDDRKYIDDRLSFRFMLGSKADDHRNFVESSLRKMTDGTCFVQIMGGDSINVTPQASNVVHITCRE